MAATTPEEANKAIVRRLYEAMNDGADDEVLELYAIDCVIHGAQGAEEGLTGRAAMEEQLKRTREAFPGITPSIEAMIAEDDLVAVRMEYTATHEGEYLGVPATGKDVGFGGTNVFRLEDGKITDVWARVDTLGVLQQLGATELPGA